MEKAYIFLIQKLDGEKKRHINVVSHSVWSYKVALTQSQYDLTICDPNTETATNFCGPEYILHNIDTYFKDKGKPR